MGNSLSTDYPLTPTQSGKRRILCIEDNLDAREIIWYSLREADYEVIFADGVTDGLRFARAYHFDLYLIDERLPDGSGIDLARQIRTFDSTTPLIFHSAIATANSIQRGLDAGAQAYLIKPSDPAEVMEVIQALIDASQEPLMHASG